MPERKRKYMEQLDDWTQETILDALRCQPQLPFGKQLTSRSSF